MFSSGNMKWLESNGIRFELESEGSMQLCMREEEQKGHSAVIFAINKRVCFPSPALCICLDCSRNLL